MGPIWAKFLEHVMQNWRTLRDAPLVFFAVLIVAFSLSYWIVGLRYAGVLDQKSGTIEDLKTQISGLERQLASRPQAAPSATVPIRDPDGVYQFGIKVGSVQDTAVDESRGTVTFGKIVDAIKLNVHANVDYRDFILHVKSAGADEQISIAGLSGRSLIQVTCEIVGRVSHQ
jgi:hypothetical protein